MTNAERLIFAATYARYFDKNLHNDTGSIQEAVRIALNNAAWSILSIRKYLGYNPDYGYSADKIIADYFGKDTNDT